MSSFFSISQTAPQRTIVMNQANRVGNPINNQKIVFVTRPPTPGGTPQPQPSQNTVVKFVSNASTLSQPKVMTTMTTQQKLGLSHLGQGNQQPIAGLPKINFQQNQPKPKLPEISQQIQMDDLSHL